MEPFTFKQKKELSLKINKLTPENLQRLVDILSPTPSNSHQLEIDLETMDDATLRKLNTFVDECLKEQNVEFEPYVSSDTDSSGTESDVESDGEELNEDVKIETIVENPEPPNEIRE